MEEGGGRGWGWVEKERKREERKKEERKGERRNVERW